MEHNVVLAAQLNAMNFSRIIISSNHTRSLSERCTRKVRLFHVRTALLLFFVRRFIIIPACTIAFQSPTKRTINPISSIHYYKTQLLNLPAVGDGDDLLCVALGRAVRLHRLHHIQPWKTASNLSPSSRTITTTTTIIIRISSIISMKQADPK